jgi:pyruvate formate lyase activating enzyme
MVQTFPQFAGVNTFSTTDFPSGMSAVFFTKGCPLRCQWCFNHELQDFRFSEDLLPEDRIDADKVEEFFHNRKGLIDAIVISGGEPLAQAGVAQFLTLAKSYGYQTGLHTSGVHPHKLVPMIDLVDWVGLDIKSLPQYYDDLTHFKNSWKLVEQTLKTLILNHIHFEARTSTSPEFLSALEIEELMYLLKDYGVKNYAIQELQSPEDKELANFSHYSHEEKSHLKFTADRLFQKFEWRESVLN